MSTIAELNARLTLNAGGFSAGLDRAQRDLRRTIAAMEKTSGLDFNVLRKNVMREASAGDIGTRFGMFGFGERDRLRQMTEAGRREAAQYSAGMASSLDRGGGAGQGFDNVRSMTRSEASAATLSASGERAAFSFRGVAKAAGLVAAGIETANVATQLFKGDVTAAAEAVKSLPFGIGHVATALESVLGEWTGIGVEIENARRATETMNAVVDSQRRALERVRDIHRETARFVAEQRNATAAAGETGPEREDADIRRRAAEQIDAEREALRKQIDEQKAATDAERAKIAESRRGVIDQQQQYEKFGKVLSKKQAEFLGYDQASLAAPLAGLAEMDRQALANRKRNVAKLTADFENRRKAIEDRAAAELKASQKRRDDETAKASREQAERGAKDSQEKADAAFRAGQDLAAIEAKTAENIRRIKGDDAGADLGAIRARFDAEIAARRRAGQADAADALERQKQSELRMRTLREEQDAAKQSAQIEMDTRAKALAILGRGAQAEAEQIRAGFDARIAEQEKQGRTEMAAKLRLQRDLEMADALGRSRGQGVQVEAFKYLATGKYGGPSAGLEAVANQIVGGPNDGTAKPNGNDLTQTELLKRIADTLSRGVSARAS